MPSPESPQPTDPTASSERSSGTGTVLVKRGMAEMLKGGVIMDVVTPDQAKIAEDAGAVAGAGIAGHLHQHVVPRWATDANFFPIVARTKALPRLLGEVRDELAAAWPA